MEKEAVSLAIGHDEREQPLFLTFDHAFRSSKRSYSKRIFIPKTLFRFCENHSPCRCLQYTCNDNINRLTNVRLPILDNNHGSVI